MGGSMRTIRPRFSALRRVAAMGLAALGLAAVGGGCVTTSTRSVGVDPGTIQQRHNVTFSVPAGWTLAEAPMHFLDTAQLTVQSPDGLAVIMEVSPVEAVKLEERVEEVRRAYAARFPTGRFHPVRAQVGSYQAAGFDGSVVTAGSSGKRLSFLYRCFNASGRFVSIQGQANAAVWGVRRGELDTFLQSVWIGPLPGRRR